ncbi:MAG: STAS domain-containing protein [Clostridia bacterium]|nr:STAS domain-containing protein [Clostridia bacterium]
MLNIKKEQQGEAAIVSLEGHLDTNTARELEEELKDVLLQTTSLTLDFEKLEYVSSAGLRVLLSAHKIMSGKGEMKLVHVSEAVMEIFDITGFSDVLNIE